MNLRAQALLGQQHVGLAGGSDGLADVAVGVVEVAEHTGTGHAGTHASRQHAKLGAVVAERALAHDVLIVHMVTGLVGAGSHAGVAADALLVVDLHGAVLGDVARAGGAGLHAGGVVAVVALLGHVGAAHIAVAVLNVPALDPRVELGQRRLVLQAACHDAGVAADALRQVDEHTQSHIAHDALLRPSRSCTCCRYGQACRRRCRTARRSRRRPRWGRA